MPAGSATPVNFEGGTTSHVSTTVPESVVVARPLTPPVNEPYVTSSSSDPFGAKEPYLTSSNAATPLQHPISAPKVAPNVLVDRFGEPILDSSGNVIKTGGVIDNRV